MPVEGSGDGRMSLTLFKKTNFSGRSHPVTSSHPNLRATPVGYRTRSLTLSSETDRALLFSRRQYGGRVAFACGSREVPHCGREFFRPLRAVRIDPFRLHLNVTVVRSGRDFPGSWTGERDALAAIDAAIDWANRVWATGMLWLERKSTRVLHDPRTFELRWPWSRVPSEWTRSGMIDVVFVHRIGRRGSFARRTPPLDRSTIVLGRMVKRGEIRNELMGHGLAHELGHRLGLGHASPRDDRLNLMAPGSPISLDPANLRLHPDQIERVHRSLAANRGRQVERHN